MLLGALMSTRPAFQRTDDEKTRKKPPNARPISYIGHNTCLMMATSGFPDSPRPPPLVDALGYVLALLLGERNNLQVWYFFVVFFWHKNPPSVQGDTAPEYSPDHNVQWLRVKP
jgi:hypothetical protein